MKFKEKVLKELDAIVFHDLPVEKISFKTEVSTDFIVDFALYQEEKKDYEYWSLTFCEIKESKSDRLELNAESDLEIFRFDYEFNDNFVCEIVFLLSFGGPSFEVKIECEKIELKRTSLDLE